MHTSATVAIGLTLLLATTVAGCAVTPGGGAFYFITKGKGDERPLTGVVTGLWRYDVAENRVRLARFLPGSTDAELDRLASRHQVRVGFEASYWSPKIVDVALLPEGWTYATTAGTPDVLPTVVQPGDVVLVRAQKYRLVDFVESVKRRCDETPTEGELKEWSLGCFEVTEFSRRGYGGKRFPLGNF